MSTILFKVWSKSKGAFLKNKEDNFFELWDFVDSLSGALLFPIDDFEFYKYAGFKDINGKSVFEGDIVKYKSWSKVNEKAQKNEEVVEFKNGEFYPRPIEEFDVKFGGFSFRIYDIRVIGNVKENPELVLN